MQKSIVNNKNLEVIVGVTHNWGRWGLPIAIDIFWHKFFDVSHIPHRVFNVDVQVDILCIRFFIKIWRWNNEPKN